MEFKSLKDKALYYRGLTDYRIMPNCYAIVMLDGRSFSKKVKKTFELPFDDDFINMMNETARYLCKNIQGALFAYVQSDEISILLSDDGDTFFGGRLNKMQPIIASMASGKFNQLMTVYYLKHGIVPADPIEIAESVKLSEFDCKVWNVPSINDAFVWFLYRQIDCVRNSKQQAAQTYLSHNELLKLDVDKQVELLRQKKGIRWEDEYDDGKKYGRFIYKETKNAEIYVKKLDKSVNCKRNVWDVHNAYRLTEEGSNEHFAALVNSLKTMRLREN